MFIVLLHTNSQKAGRENPKILGVHSQEAADWEWNTERLCSPPSPDSCNPREVLKSSASMALSGKWVNHLVSDPPPWSVARINELIMLGEHWELWMKDTEEQSRRIIMHN